jgi:V/A-type H+/Na+-transporting ATPase subunit A
VKSPRASKKCQPKRATHRTCPRDFPRSTNVPVASPPSPVRPDRSRSSEPSPQPEATFPNRSRNRHCASRHFPAINWANSYSLFQNILEPWYRKNIAQDYPEKRKELITLLQKEAALQEVVQLVGPDALADAERLSLEVGRIVREDFLQQNGYDKIDASCSMEKAYGLINMMLELYKAGDAMLAKGGAISDFLDDAETIEKVGRARFVPENEFAAYQAEYMKMLETAFSGQKKAVA